MYFCNCALLVFKTEIAWKFRRHVLFAGYLKYSRALVHEHLKNLEKF